jgi:glycosyltransferase involved in cell wall biosynthesis
VTEVLDSVAPYISSWVIVDTGSEDGTQDIVRSHTVGLGIPGELHQRSWRDFGHNRSEALTLAQGHGDYIWVIDADDLLIGTPDFSQLTADSYQLRYGNSGGLRYWRRQVFRDGMPWRYQGVVHEYPECKSPHTQAHLGGAYYIESRRLGARSRDPHKYARDAELLLAEVQRHPEDGRWVFYLAQSYFDAGDYANARQWYRRRSEMGGWAEEVYLALFRLAESMARDGAPWPEVQHTYLRAWEFRPTRAEPLHALARRYRLDKRYRLGYLFAAQAAQISQPQDTLFVATDVYTWRARDEQSVCAAPIGKKPEAFTLCRSLLARPDIPEDQRQRIAANRDVCVPAMLKAASTHPEATARRVVAGPYNADITVTLIAGSDRAATEATLDSFLHCCRDVARVGRFLVLTVGPSIQDRVTLLQRYPFLDFTPGAATDSAAAQHAHLRTLIGGQFWLHLGQGWRFFAPENLITRLRAVLHAEPEVFQVGINYTDAVSLTGTSAPEQAVRRASETGRYVLTDVAAVGPAMIDTTRLDPVVDLIPAKLGTASLDEVLCVAEI